MKHYSFTDYLKDKCELDGGFEGKVDDDYEDAFEAWLGDVDPVELIDLGDQYGELLSIRIMEELGSRETE